MTGPRLHSSKPSTCSKNHVTVHGLTLKVSGKQTAGTKISDYNIKRDVVNDISFALINIGTHCINLFFIIFLILFLISKILINFDCIPKMF